MPSKRFCSFSLLIGLQAHQGGGKAGASRRGSRAGHRGAHRVFAGGRRKRRAALPGSKPLRWANALAHQPYQRPVRGLPRSSRARKPPSQGASHVITDKLRAPRLASILHLAGICHKLRKVESKENPYCNSACHQFKDVGLLPEEEERQKSTGCRAPQREGTSELYEEALHRA